MAQTKVKKSKSWPLKSLQKSVIILAEGLMYGKILPAANCQSELLELYR